MTKHCIDPNCDRIPTVHAEGHDWCEECYDNWLFAIDILEKMTPEQQRSVANCLGIDIGE